jgi:transglutaminase-like putative cysteine protease
LEASSAEKKTAKIILGRKKRLIPAVAIILTAAAGWILAWQLNKPGGRRPPAAGYTIAKQIQYSYTLQNKTNRVIPKAELWVHAPVKQTAGQRCLDLNANYPYQLLTDDDGNQVLYFTFENLAPYASRLISIKADLLVARSANPIAAEPQTADLNPETYIESDHPAIRRAANQLQSSDLIETIIAIFDWVATQVRYSGYNARELGALYALENRKGDCTEYMDLFVALCRANGIPARRIGGYICPENAVLKARDYHNWGEFYGDGLWQIADAQNKVLMQNQGDYIAMRIIRASEDNPMGSYNRFRFKGEGLKVRMN